jgi:hypothetical protein
MSIDSFSSIARRYCSTQHWLISTQLQIKGAVNLGLRESKPSEQVYKGIRDCVKTIYKQNGLKGLYRGMGMLYEFHILLKPKI